MAKGFNVVILIGRAGRDPEVRSFSDGGKVATIGLCVNNSKKDQSGQWVDDPMWIDVSFFNRGNSKLADIVEQYVHKGSQIGVEGRLHLESWNDKQTGQKRLKHKIVAEQIQLLDGKPQGGQAQEQRRDTRQQATRNDEPSDEQRDEPSDHGAAHGEEIPF